MQLLDEPLDVNHKWCWKRLDNPRNAGFHIEIQHVPWVLSLSAHKSMLKTSTHQSIFTRKYHCEAPSFHWTCVLNHWSHISLADNFVDQSVNGASLLSPQKSKCIYSISNIQVYLLKCLTTSGFHPFGYLRYDILAHPSFVKGTSNQYQTHRSLTSPWCPVVDVSTSKRGHRLFQDAIMTSVFGKRNRWWRVQESKKSNKNANHQSTW